MKQKQLHLLLTAVAFITGLTSCSDIIDNPVNQENTDTPTETTDMPELKLDFESMVDWYAAAIKKCHPLMKQVWGSAADPADYWVLL